MMNFQFESNPDGVLRGYEKFRVCMIQCKNHLRRLYELQGNHYTIEADIYKLLRDDKKYIGRKLLGSIEFDGEHFIDKAAQ